MAGRFKMEKTMAHPTIIYSIKNGADFINFESVAHDNILKICTQDSQYYGLFTSISSCFDRLLSHFQDYPYDKPGWATLFFLPRCQSAYLATGRMAMSCQFQETCMLARGTIENALYSFHVYINSDLASLWLRRHEDDKTKKSARDAFKYIKVIKTLSDKNPTFASYVDDFYKKMIDFGAHPNVFGSVAVTERTEEKGKILFNYECLTGNSIHHECLLFDVLDAGLISLKIFSFIFEKEFENIRLIPKLKQISLEIDCYAKKKGVQASSGTI